MFAELLLDSDGSSVHEAEVLQTIVGHAEGRDDLIDRVAVATGDLLTEAMRTGDGPVRICVGSHQGYVFVSVSVPRGIWGTTIR